MMTPKQNKRKKTFKEKKNRDGNPLRTPMQKLLIKFSEFNSNIYFKRSINSDLAGFIAEMQSWLNL